MAYSPAVSETRIGIPERPLRVAVIGAGPSGFYTVAALLKAENLAVSVDVFDRLPAPYGLVRYGVAPDHQKIKRVARVFEKVALDERVRFFGNVTFGEDLTHDELTSRYDQVVYAVGGQTDRRLGIPGEDLQGSLSSTEFVYWYSGHPDFLDLDVPLDCEQAAVVGIGNVAMDVARVLARSADDLATTDIADIALTRLRESRVRDVHILSRRGPVQAKCTPPELKELGEIEGVAVVVDPQDLQLEEASARAMADDRQAIKNLELLQEYATPEEDPAGADRRIHFHFLVSPVELLEKDGRVGGVVLERNHLDPREGGYLAAVGTGEREELPATLVIRAVGYRSVPLPDVPFDERRGLIPNEAGRVIDPRTEKPFPGEYAVGWVKRGPTGLIGSNKPDAQETVEAMLEDLPDLVPVDHDLARLDAVEELLRERHVRWVGFDEWQRLEAMEVQRGEAQGRPRVKFCRIEEMLEALEGD
jgi:ferredoxin--NADP+ reductase